MKVKTLLMIPSLLGVFFTSCNNQNGTTSESMPVEPGIDLAALDTTVTPGDDFYRYSNGGWIKANPLKPAYSRYGAFDLLRDRSLEQIHEIVVDLSEKSQQKGTNEYRVAVLYKQAMDSITRNELGAKPILEDIKEIEAIKIRPS